jgi:hypothetical protein
MTVINLADHRPPKNNSPCRLTFFGSSFEAGNSNITWSITIEDGDYVGVIEAVKQNGGIYAASQDRGKTYWFLPWPCAAVRICPGG